MIELKKAKKIKSKIKNIMKKMINIKIKKDLKKIINLDLVHHQEGI
jgi:hypothetical protein